VILLRYTRQMLQMCHKLGHKYFLLMNSISLFTSSSMKCYNHPKTLSNKPIMHKIKLIITDTLTIIQGQCCKSEPEGGEVVSGPVTNMQPHLTAKSHMPYKIRVPVFYFKKM